MRFLFNLSEQLTYSMIRNFRMACYDVIVDSKQSLPDLMTCNLKMACHEIVNDFE